MSDKRAAWFAYVLEAIRHRKVWHMMEDGMRNRILCALRNASYGAEEAIEFVDDLEDEISMIAQQVVSDLLLDEDRLDRLAEGD